MEEQVVFLLFTLQGVAVEQVVLEEMLQVLIQV
jgi:hypothetical protein